MTTDSTAVMHCDNLARHYRQGVERIDVLKGLHWRFTVARELRSSEHRVPERPPC